MTTPAQLVRSRGPWSPLELKWSWNDNLRVNNRPAFVFGGLDQIFGRVTWSGADWEASVDLPDVPDKDFQQIFDDDWMSGADNAMTHVEKVLKRRAVQVLYRLMQRCVESEEES